MFYIMENTLENKAKFFALYYGQEVLTRDDGFRKFWKLGSEVSIESSLSKYGYGYGYYLELTSLSQITDEDLKPIHPHGVKAFFTYYGSKEKAIDALTFGCNRKEADYLRFKGYALPWMGLSVEQLIEYGWVKLKQSEQSNNNQITIK